MQCGAPKLEHQEWQRHFNLCLPQELVLSQIAQSLNDYWDHSQTHQPPEADKATSICNVCYKTLQKNNAPSQIYHHVLRPKSVEENDRSESIAFIHA